MLTCGIFKAGKFIEGLMVQAKDYRISNRLHFGIVDNPANLVHFARHLKANLVAMAVKPMALVICWHFGEPMGTVD